MTTNVNPFVHEIGERGRFALKVPAGEVEVTGTGGVEARVHDVDGRSLEDRFLIDARPGSLTLRLRDGSTIGDFLRGRDNGRLHLRVEVPAAVSVSVETASAGIVADGLRGEQRYRTASGDLRLAGSGSYTIDSVSGDVTVRADGELDLAARAVSGDIRVEGGRVRSAGLTTTSGDVTLDTDLHGPGPFTIQSVSGDARVRAGSGLRVEAKTLTGELDGALGALDDVLGRRGRRRGRNDLVYGDGSTLLTFKSISGDLIVTDSSPASGASLSHGAPEPPALPATPTPPTPPIPPAAPGRSPVAAAVREDERLTILKDLEEGRIDVAEATARLAALDGDDDA